MITKLELTTTSLFVAVIVFHLVVHITLLARWSRWLRETTKAVVNRLGRAGANRGATIQPITSEPRLIQSFLFHLVEIDGKLHRTTDSAVFLSDAEVLGWSIHFKYLAAVPSQLLGIGIAGTFFSLRGALANLADVSNVGSRTGEALLSSLAGLTASIVFATVLSARSAVLRVDLARLAEVLDLHYPVASLEHLQMMTYRQIALLRDALPETMDQVLNRRLTALEGKLSNALTPFQEAWRSSIDQTLAKWVREFESGALTVTKSYQAEIDRQRAILMSAVDRDLDAAGKWFSTTLRRAVADVRSESIKAFSMGFSHAKTELDEALKTMAVALAKSAAGIGTEIKAASTEARNSAGAVKTSFEDVRRQIDTVRDDIEISAGKAITAYERRLKLVIDESTAGSILISDTHREVVTSELRALKEWTEQLRVQIDRMLVGFASALTLSVDQIINERRNGQ